MKLAILSGKGGTGKTLLSVNLAAAGRDASYLDCDVEAPNGHLYFKPEDVAEETVEVLVPAVDPVRCTGCRTCVEFCRFNALAHVPSGVVVFEEICHNCGGCAFLCPAGAIFEQPRQVGRVRSGVSGQVSVHSGILEMGEASGVPVIRRVLEKAGNGLTVIDCPPGSACTVMESIREADYCLLVAEPSVFGAQNLQMVHELVSIFNKPCGAVLNKCGEGDNPSEAYCAAHGIPIVGRLPYDAALGRLNSEGRIAVREDQSWNLRFQEILRSLPGKEGGA